METISRAFFLFHIEVDLYTPYTHKQTISTRTLSPVKVTCHFYEGDDEAFTTDIADITPPDQLPPTKWRRFSSNFVGSVKWSEKTSDHSDTGGWCVGINVVLCIIVHWAAVNSSSNCYA